MKHQLLGYYSIVVILRHWFADNFLFSKVENRKGTIKYSILILLFFVSFLTKAQLATETFESGIPSTWVQENNSFGTSVWTTTTDGYNSASAAFIDPSSENIGIGNTAEYFLITPLVTLPTNGELRFFTKQSDLLDKGNVYEIRISTASQPDISGFTTVLASWTETGLNTTSPIEYEEKVVEIPSAIPAGLNVYIAFVLVNTQTGTEAEADTWFIDNVQLQEAAVCPNINLSEFFVSNITTNSANFNWTYGESADYEIIILPQGDPITGSGQLTNGFNISINDLDEDTAYSAYIRALCNNGATSTWTGPLNFSTQMLGLSCTTPIVLNNLENENYLLSSNLDLYANPDVVYSTHGSNCLPASITQNYLNGAKIFFEFTPSVNGLLNISQFTNGGTGCWNHITGVFVYEGCSNVGIECMAGINTTTVDVPKYISNLYLNAGTTYIIVLSSQLTQTASICFNLEISFSDCAPPAAFTYENLLQESVSFSWDNEGLLVNNWEYVVLPATSGEPTASGTATTTNTNNEITGLSANTAYNLYVRSVCGGTPSQWSNPYSFTTLCNTFETPYFTDFVGSTATNPEPCWTSIDVNGDGIKWSYLAGWQAGYLGYATLQTNTNQNFNHDYLVSPQINFDGITQKRIRYSHQITGGNSSSYSIRISTTGVGVDNFTIELQPETVITNTTWQEIIYNIPIEIVGNVNIAWVVSPIGSGQNATRISLTNVYIEDKPNCPNPISPVLVDGSITTTTAQFSWTAGDEETQWEVIAIPINAPAPDAETEGIITSTNTNYIYENLDPAKRYKFYVRAYCSEEFQSEWVGPVNFITECITFEVPFYESFNDNDDDTQKFCWTLLNENADAAAWNMGTQNPSIQGSMSWFNPTISYDDWLISPAISGEGTKELKYSYRARFSPLFAVSRYGIQVLISYTDTNPDSFVELAPLDVFTNTDYEEKSIYFNATGTFYIAFRVPPHFVIAPGTSILDIDDVYIIDAADCPNPSTLEVNNILENSAEFSWNPGFEEESWEITVQLAGTGTPSENGIVVSTNSYEALTLLPGTTYEFYVRAICGDDNQSNWVGPISFTTLCEAFNTPFLETFEEDSASEYCWRIINANNDDYTFLLDIASFPYEGNESAGMFTGSNGQNDDWLISPTINILEGQRLRFFYRVNSEFFTEDLMVKMSTNGIDTSQFTTILFDTEQATFNINNNFYKEMVINLPAGVTGPVNFAWHIPPMPPGPQGYRGQILLIDNVIVEDIPECPTPINVSLSNIADTSVQVNWEATGSETQWEIVVQPFGGAAPEATANPDYTHLASTNPFTVTDLDPAIKYQVYVRAICDETQSPWTEAIEFNTLCSFENLCQYTITLSGGTSSGVGGGIDVIQNGVVYQTLNWPTGPFNTTPDPVIFTVFLCDGVEFSLFWDSIGTAPNQYPNAQVQVANQSGEIVWTSELGIGTPRTTLFTGIAICSEVTCPQPTDLASDDFSELTWTAGGNETQWEVFIQPYQNGTLPQTGTIVSTNSYIPVAEDYTAGNDATYEFFVRAICDNDDNSFWSGPFVFARNNSASNAIVIPVNEDETCLESVKASFAGSIVSIEDFECDGINGGDIWYEFTATSKTHLIELDNFSGNHYYSSGNAPFAPITMSLYSSDDDNTLEQITCSYNNAIATMYTSELIIGNTYKLRIIKNLELESPYTFDICIKTISNPCTFSVINGSFEQHTIPFGAINNIITQNIITGWRYNLFGYWNNDAIFYIPSLNNMGLTPYDGNQLVQLFSSDTGAEPDLNNIDGLYQDLDSSEISQYDFSFAHGSRSGLNTVDLYAGPPQGPFELIQESTVSTMSWSFNEGIYIVPEGQEITRFIFRVRNGALGQLLDAVSFTPNNKIITENQSLDCNVSPLEVQANGIGVWSADENNPSSSLFENPSNNITTVTGFTVSGTYTFYWNTKYCTESFTVTYEGFEDTPIVETPIEYCLNNNADPLTASTLEGYTQIWYTQEIGGTGSVIAPTPNTSEVGATIYYVAFADENGCEGPRTSIEVVVFDSIQLEPIDDVEECEAYILPELDAGNYYTESMGTGDLLLAGTVITETQFIYVYTSQGECEDEIGFIVTILEIEVPTFEDVEICDEYVLPQLDSGISYRTGPGGSGDELSSGTVLTESQTVYIYASSGDCTAESSFEVTINTCLIQRGISPNNDGLNDFFDLTGFNVEKLSIFNRYGMKVYNRNNYVNEWGGQSNNGNELPDGTYYYVIERANGQTHTGWIYINRERN